MHKFFNFHLNFFLLQNHIEKTYIYIHTLSKTIIYPAMKLNQILVIIITPLNNYKNWLRKRLWSMMHFAKKKKERKKRITLVSVRCSVSLQ